MNIAVIGQGSGGSILADMSGRYGFEELDVIDHDILTEINCKRHVLTLDDVGKNKAIAMAVHLSRVSECEVYVQDNRFGEYKGPASFDHFQKTPDVIVSCVDSLQCESLINAYALQHKIPAVYGGVHGAAHTAEIITVIPGETPCYECWEREGPEPEPDARKYTDPTYDPTQVPHQEGLWCDVLMTASLQFQAVLGVLGVREKFPPLMLASLRYPFAIETFNQKERCAVCSEDFSQLRV